MPQKTTTVAYSSYHSRACITSPPQHMTLSHIPTPDLGLAKDTKHSLKREVTPDDLYDSS